MLYHDQHRYMNVTRYAIELNGSFFNTDFMVDQHVRNASLR